MLPGLQLRAVTPTLQQALLDALAAGVTVELRHDEPADAVVVTGRLATGLHQERQARQLVPQQVLRAAAGCEAPLACAVAHVHQALLRAPA